MCTCVYYFAAWPVTEMITLARIRNPTSIFGRNPKAIVAASFCPARRKLCKSQAIRKHQKKESAEMASSGRLSREIDWVSGLRQGPDRPCCGPLCAQLDGKRRQMCGPNQTRRGAGGRFFLGGREVQAVQRRLFATQIAAGGGSTPMTTTATTYSPGLEGVVAGETAICTV